MHQKNHKKISSLSSGCLNLKLCFINDFNLLQKVPESKDKVPLASLYRIKPLWRIFHWLYTVQYVHCTFYTRYTDLCISSIIASDGYLRSLRTSFSTQNLIKYALHTYLEVKSRLCKRKFNLLLLCAPLQHFSSTTCDFWSWNLQPRG